MRRFQLPSNVPCVFIDPYGEWVKAEDALAEVNKLAGLLDEMYNLFHVHVCVGGDFGNAKFDPFRGAANGEGSTINRVRSALAQYRSPATKE